MGWTVFPLSTLAKVEWANSNLFQKDLCQQTLPYSTAAVSACDPVAGHCQPTALLRNPKYSQAILAQSFVRTLLLYPGSWCTQGFLCALQESVSLVLWKFCNQIPVVFKVKFPGGSQFFCQIPRLGNLLWALELLQQCEKFLGIITSSLCIFCLVALFSSVAQSCPTLCNPMNRSTPGLPVHHQLPEFTQTHVHRVGDAIQPYPYLNVSNI